MFSRMILGIAISATGTWAVNQPFLLQFRVPIQVTWQKTVSTLPQQNLATSTESFRETWYLEVLRDGSLYLKSPRYRRPVYGKFLDNGAFTVPGQVLVKKSDFARLVGVYSFGAQDQESSGQLIPLILDKTDQQEVRFEIPHQSRYSMSFTFLK